MTKRILSAALALSLCSLATLGAQTAPAAGPANTQATSTTAPAARQTLSIDDLYLSQEVEVQLLRTQAQTNNRESKLLALQDIGSLIESGRVNSDSRDVLAILDALSGEGVTRQVTTNGSVSNNFPEVRREAARLLGRVGGPAATATLVRMLTTDRESMVLSEAVYALGLTATTDNSTALPFITQMLHLNNSSATPDANLTFATLLTIERMAAAQGGIADPEVINVVLDAAFAGKYPRNVTLKALQVLGKMRAR